MYLFLIPLFLPFLFNVASAFTAAYTRRLGERGGQLTSTVLRNLPGLPLLGVAFVLAARLPGMRWLAVSMWANVIGGLLFVAGAVIILWALMALRWRAATHMHKISLTNVRYCLQTHPHANHLDLSHLLSRSPGFGLVGAPRLHLHAPAASLERADQTFRRDVPPNPFFRYYTFPLGRVSKGHWCPREEVMFR